MRLETQIQIPDTLFVQEIDDEMVILDTASEEYFGLDTMGAVMWQELQKSGSLQQVYDVISAAYEVDTVRLENDIIAFAEVLLDAGLLKIKS